MKAALALALTGAASAGSLMARGCSTVDNVITTFYGWPDNSPPGAGTAYDCGRGYTAGGSGTYDDPLTFATAPGEFNQCEVIYSSYLKKYLVFQDTCDQCTTDWSSGQYHTDIWTGSSTSGGGQNQIDCEDNLTPNNQQVVRSPASNLPVDSKFTLALS